MKCVTGYSIAVDVPSGSVTEIETFSFVVTAIIGRRLDGLAFGKRGAEQSPVDPNLNCSGRNELKSLNTGFSHFSTDRLGKSIVHWAHKLVSHILPVWGLQFNPTVGLYSDLKIVCWDFTGLGKGTRVS